MVARAHRRRPRLLLGLPAPGQPLAAGAGPRPALAGALPSRAGRRREGGRPHRGRRRLRRRGRRRPDRLPLELHPPAGRLAPGGARLPRRARPDPGQPVDARRGRDGLGGRAAHRRARPPRRGDVPALPAAARPAPPRVVERGPGGRPVGAVAGRGRRTAAAGPGPGALGCVQRVLRPGRRDGRRGRRRTEGAGAVLGGLPLRRRAPLLRHRGRAHDRVAHPAAGLLPDPQPPPAGHAGPRVRDVARGPSAGAAAGRLGQGAGPQVVVARGRRSLVRQQPGAAGDR